MKSSLLDIESKLFMTVNVDREQNGMGLLDNAKLVLRPFSNANLVADFIFGQVAHPFYFDIGFGRFVGERKVHPSICRLGPFLERTFDYFMKFRFVGRYTSGRFYIDPKRHLLRWPSIWMVQLSEIVSSVTNSSCRRHVGTVLNGCGMMHWSLCGPRIRAKNKIASNREGEDARMVH